MSDFPSVVDYDIPVVSNAGLSSLGPELLAFVPTVASTVWPTTNLALYYPFSVAVETTIVKMFWINGGTVGTNSVDVGIYGQDGNRLVSGGGVLTTGASVEQIVDITDTILVPGIYYLAMAMNGTTDNIKMLNSIGAATTSGLGVYEQTTAYPLPSTATFAHTNRTVIPLIFTTRNTLV